MSMMCSTKLVGSPKGSFMNVKHVLVLVPLDRVKEVLLLIFGECVFNCAA